jgi:hypothetical protein
MGWQASSGNFDDRDFIVISIDQEVNCQKKKT